VIFRADIDFPLMKMKRGWPPKYSLWPYTMQSPTGNVAAQCYDDKKRRSHMRSRARPVTICVALSALIFGVFPVSAAGDQDKPVKIVVPFAPAGPTDVMARLIAQKLSEGLKQQFYVENHPGAGGNIGMTQVAKSAPDGYTILVASSSYVVNPSLYAKTPYD